MVRIPEERHQRVFIFALSDNEIGTGGSLIPNKSTAQLHKAGGISLAASISTANLA